MDELRLTNHPQDGFTSLADKQMCEGAMKEEYPLCWKKTKAKLYWNNGERLHLLLRGRSWGSKEGQGVQLRVCAETTFGCRLANVTVTVLSAVFPHFIKKCPVEHSWMRSSSVPQQTAMLLQLPLLGKTQQFPCRCFTVTSCCGDTLRPHVEDLAGNMELELTSVTASGAFWTGPPVHGGHRGFQHTRDAFPAGVTYQQVRKKGQEWPNLL